MPTGIQRQNLPKPLARGGEKIYELIGRRPKVADSAVGRQGGGMQ